MSEQKKLYIYSPELNINRWRPLINELSSLYNVRVYNDRFVNPFYLSSRLSRQNALELPKIHLLKKDIVAFNPHIIHILGEPSYFSTYYIAKNFSSQAIVTCRGAQNIYIPRIFPFSYFWRLNKKLLNHVISPSVYSSEFYKQNGYKLTSVIANGINNNFFEALNNVKRNFHFGFVGKFIKRKGIHLLLKSLSELKTTKKFIFVGEGPLRPLIEDFANSTHHDVTITGRLDHKELKQTLRDIETLIVPSEFSDGTDWGLGQYTKHLATPWLEQYGMVVTEALANGCRVVCSDSGGLAEFSEIGCEVFQERSKEQLLKFLLKEYTHDYFDATKFQDSVSLYNWKTLASEYKKLWQNI